MARLTPDESDLRFVRRLALVLLALAGALFVYKAADLLLLAFGGVLGGVLLAGGADAIAARTHIARGWALFACVLLLFATLGLMGWLFGSATLGQAEALEAALPRQWAAVEAWLGRTPAGPFLLSSGKSLGGTRAAAILLGAGWGIGEVAVNFLIILVAAIFFAAEPRLYRRGALLLTPPPYRGAVADALDDVVRALRLWLLTQLVSMTLMGLMIGFGLWLSGVPAWAALGLLGGLSEFIPYVGPTLAMVPAIIVALAGGASVWGVLLTYLLVRIVQANVITPLISRQVVSVPPGLYLFLILAAGYAFGTFGLFFSGALAVTGYTLVIRLYVRETLGEAVKSPGEH